MAEQNFDNSRNTTARQMVEDAWLDQDKVSLIKQFLKNLPQYQQLCAEVEYTRRKRLDDNGIAYATVSGRAKTLESFLEKLNRKSYDDPLTQITDFAGVRVVFLYLSDREAIEQIIEAEFSKIEKIDKVDEQENDRFGYAALHYLVELGAQPSGARYDTLKHLTCEIQVRTILQDAWAVIDHRLVYKRESDMPKDVRRGINALSATFEMADKQFDVLRTQQQEYVRKAEERTLRNDLEQQLDVHTLEAYLRERFLDRAFLPEGFDFSHLLFLLRESGLNTLKALNSFLDSQEPVVRSIESSNGSMRMNVYNLLRYSLMAGDKSQFINKHSSFLGGGSAQQSIGQTIEKYRARLVSQSVKEDRKSHKT